MEYKVELSPRAQRDLAEIAAYLYELAPENAGRFCLHLAQEAFSLRTFPERNAELPRKRGVRKMPTGDYLIFYRIFAAERRVEILRFWHGARNPRSLRLREEAPVYAAPA